MRAGGWTGTGFLRTARSPVPRRAALAAPVLLLAPRARAQGAGAAWRPAQQVRIVVPSAAGGTTDTLGRLCAAHLQARWGVPVVVESRTGAGGTIGTLEVVRARPDGTTFLSGNIGPQAIAYSLFRDLPYRPDQLVPVAGLLRGPNLVVVNAASPVGSMADLAAWLRAEPGRVRYASSGMGQSTHLTAAWLLQLLDARAVHLPFRGSAPAQAELLAGHVGFMVDNLTAVIGQVRGGRLRALAVTSAERNAGLPDVPAARETLPELARFEVNTWFGLFGPAGLPGEVIRAVNAEIDAMLGLAGTRQRIDGLGGVPLRLAPEAFGDWVRAETEKWRAVIRKEGLQLDPS